MIDSVVVAPIVLGPGFLVDLIVHSSFVVILLRLRELVYFNNVVVWLSVFFVSAPLVSWSGLWSMLVA